MSGFAKQATPLKDKDSHNLSSSIHSTKPTGIKKFGVQLNETKPIEISPMTASEIDTTDVAMNLVCREMINKIIVREIRRKIVAEAVDSIN